MATPRASTPQLDTVFVGNLPKTATSEELESVFREIGEIRRCFAVQTNEEPKTCRGFGFVTFSVKKNAEKALKGKFELHGRKLRVQPTKANNGSKEEKEGKKKFPNLTNEKKARLIVRNIPFKADAELLETTFSKFGKLTDSHIPKKPDGKMRGFAFIQFDNMKSAINALNEMNGKEMLGRPIAVDFAVSRDKYMSVNSKTDNSIVNEVSIKSEDNDESVDEGSDVEDDDAPVKEEGDSEEESIDDISTNTSTKHGSPAKESQKSKNQSTHKEDIDVDSSDSYESEEESEDEDSAEEGDDDVDLDGSDSDDIEAANTKRVDGSSDEDSDSDDIEEANNKGVEGSSDEDSDSSTDLEEALKKRNESKRPNERKRQFSDASDGRTLFIRNVPFGIEQEDLKDAMEKFGPLNYVRLCINWETECPNGKAFARFQKKDDAEKCLTESNTEEGKIILDGRQLFTCLALTKEDLTRKLNETDKKEEKGKDKRNLYLAREGLIRPGSEAAQGVSKGDQDKRMQRESTKRKLLQNLHNFVSSTRLFVNNIPPNLNDSQLKKLFLDAVDDERAVISEARIMKDKADKSKGFGFVTFALHEHALKVLRKLNNNPNIFSPKSRPIVEFSIENLNILNAKEKRLENSKKNVPFQQNKKLDSPSDGSRTAYKHGNSSTPAHAVKRMKNDIDRKDSSPAELQLESNSSGNMDESLQTYSGFRAQVGIKKMPSHTGPKIRHKERKQMHGKDSSRKTKSLQKSPGPWIQAGIEKPAFLQKVDKTKRSATEFVVSPEKNLKPQSKKAQKGKKRRKQASDDQEENVFRGLVKKYKSHLLSWQGQEDRKKWFEEEL